MFLMVERKSRGWFLQVPCLLLRPVLRTGASVGFWFRSLVNRQTGELVGQAPVFCQEKSRGHGLRQVMCIDETSRIWKHI